YNNYNTNSSSSLVRNPEAHYTTILGSSNNYADNVIFKHLDDGGTNDIIGNFSAVVGTQNNYYSNPLLTSTDALLTNDYYLPVMTNIFGSMNTVFSNTNPSNPPNLENAEIT